MSYPVELRLTGKSVLVVGGGRLASAHVEHLLAAGARPRIVAPEVVTELAGHIERDGLTWERRSFEERDLEAAWLVLALTDDAPTNERVCELSDRAGKLVYGDGEGFRGNLALPAVLRRGDLTIAVATGVAHLARNVVLELEDDYGPDFAAYTERLQATCERLAREVPDALERQRQIHRLTSPAVLSLVRAGDRQEWEELLESALQAPNRP